MMKRTVTNTVAMLCGAVVAFAAGIALAQTTSPLETMVRMHSEPDEYYFFEDDRKEIVNYKEPRTVRICTGESKHLVPLKITYDQETAMIASGDCMRVEASEVYLEPAETLDDNWVIEADVETID